MKRFPVIWRVVLGLVWTSSVTLSGVAGSVAAPSNPVSQPSFQFRPGADVAEAITKRYQDTRDNCGSESRPAFLCSGILLRATEPSVQYESWDPSPTAVRVGAVSFSYLRADFNLLRFAHKLSNGFIFKPVLETEALKEKQKMMVLCFFPVDGTSDARSESGCGPHPSYPQSSRPCDLQEILTGEQYAEHFRKKPTSYAWRCGFNVRDSENARAGRNFYQGLRGGQMVTGAGNTVPSDLKIAVWAQDIPDRLPIEAFFYINDKGRAGAQHDQKRFYLWTGVDLPIISIKLATTANGTATFAYLPADQAISFSSAP